MIKQSVIVIVYDMPRQALNTLASLAVPYQKNVAQDEYEVIVVENNSGNNLDPAAVAALGPQFRYFLRDEPGVSPVPAVNFAVAQARGEQLGLIIDGARMLTPRVLEYAWLGHLMSDESLIMVPGYHLGEQDQKFHLETGHSEDLEIEKLAQLQWQQNGYRLFEWACWSPSNLRGYLQPMLECNAFFCKRSTFLSIGGLDPRFDQPGGGSVNLYIYRRLGLIPHSRLFVLPGEGSFHQFHGGVTTKQLPTEEQRLAMLKAFDQRLEEVWGGEFNSLTREPIMLGSVTMQAQVFFTQALKLAEQRYKRLDKLGKVYWEDDALLNYWTANAISRLDDGYRIPEEMAAREPLPTA